MDMKIAGRGKIPAGEYGRIRISGSGCLYGDVACASFSASGATKGENIECAEAFRSSGRCFFSGDIKANSVNTSGSFTCKGDLTAKEISFSGSTKVRKSMKCDTLSSSGSLKVSGDIEAKKLWTSGSVNCDGLIKGETVEIKVDKVMNIGGINGKTIRIKRKLISVFPRRRVIIASDVEGDELYLEYVTCPRVTGKRVTLGKGCKIDLVQYSESLEASQGSKLGQTEKI